MSLTSEREEIEWAVEHIEALWKTSAEEEYLDTGDALDVIKMAKAALVTALERYDLMGWAE